MADDETTWLRDRRLELQRLVGEAVKRVRSERADGMTQAGLAKRIGEVLDEMEPDRPSGGALTFQTTVSRIEGGRYQLTLETIDVLARALDVDPLTLLGAAFPVRLKTPEQIETARAMELAAVIDRAWDSLIDMYQETAESPEARRAVEALVQLHVSAPEAIGTIARMLEGLHQVTVTENYTAQQAPGGVVDPLLEEANAFSRLMQFTAPQVWLSIRSRRLPKGQQP